MKKLAPLTILLVLCWLPARSLAQDQAAPPEAKKSKSKKKKKARKAKSGKPAAAIPDAPQSETGTLDTKYASDLVEKPSARYFRTEWKKHPAIRLGKWFRADFRLKVEQDFRTYDPEVSTDEGELANLRKFRVGVEGYVTKSFEYRVERELRDEIAEWTNMRTRPTLALWRDVYGNWRYFRRIQIRAGQFKIPFGMDQLHHPEFVNRSLIGNFLAPGRDQGVMAHGKLFDSRLAYQAGIFVHDGWKAHTKDHEYSGERTLAARLVTPPLSFLPTPGILKIFKSLELGGAIAQSPVTEGLNSLRGRTWVITHNWFDRVNVRGHRLRLGGELNWQPGPFTVRGEVIRVSDQRLGQGLRGNDLPDLIARGWYASAAWVVTGEKSAGGVEPRHNFVPGRGWGAVELAARLEQLRFGSAEHPGLPSRSSRAANISGASERVATFGANWYVNHNVMIQFNAYRELVEDLEKTPINNVGSYWSRFVRIQFGF